MLCFFENYFFGAIITINLLSLITDWQGYIDRYQDRMSHSVTEADSVKYIYNRCKKIQKLYSCELSENFSLQNQFNQLEIKVHRIFFCVLKIQSERQGIVLHRSQFNDEQKKSLLDLLQSLYHGDNSKTSAIVSSLPIDIATHFFRNLHALLGTPFLFETGRFAFLDVNNCSASTREKFEAIICSLSREFALECLTEVGAISDMEMFDVDLLPKDVLGKCIVIAAEKGHIDCLRWLLCKKKTSRFLHVVDTVRSIASNYLLFCLPIQQKSQWRAIPTEFIYHAINGAAKNGWTTCLEFLLQDVQARAVNIDTALFQTTKNGYIDCLRLLIESRSVTNLTINNALIDAAENGHTVCFALLLEQNPIFSTYLDKAAKIAAKYGYIDILTLIFRKEEITEERIITIINSAVRHNCIESLQFIKQSIDLDTLDLSRPLLHAATYGRLNCLFLLFPNTIEVSQPVFDDAVLRASERGFLFVVQYLLITGVLTRAGQNYALLRAELRGHYDICNLIESAVTIANQGLLEVEEDIPQMTVSLQAIKDNCVRSLKIFSLTSLPISFRIVESPESVDLGGLSKHVYSSLFSALIENKVLFLTTFHVPRIERKKDLRIYATLGRFYSHLIHRNKSRTDPYLTGYVFSIHFFAFLKHVLTFPDDELGLAKMLKTIDIEQTCCFNLLLDQDNSEEIEKVKNLMEILYEEEDDPLKYCYKLLRSYFDPVQAFLQGAQDSGVSSLLFTKIRELPAESLAEVFQGKAISPELVLNAIEVSQVGGIAFLQKVKIIKNRIRNADQRWLEMFVFAITGSKALALGVTLHIQPAEVGSVYFQFQTCFNLLLIPVNSLSEEEFLQSLEASMQNSDFNIV